MQFFLNILCRNIFISFLLFGLVPECLASGATECYLFPTSSITYPLSTKIWKLRTKNIFETKTGFFIKVGIGVKYFNFNNGNESIATLINKNNNQFYVVTRTAKGYALYLFNFSKLKLDEVYRKNLSFTVSNQKYSSTLVDIIVQPKITYIVTNFRILSYKTDVFLTNGHGHHRSRILVKNIDHNPDRIVDLRIIDDHLQVLAFRNGSYKRPYILHQQRIKAGTKGLKFSHLSDEYMRRVDTHIDHPLFIYGDNAVSTIISTKDDYRLGSSGYILSAYFENQDLTKGFGAILFKDKGLVIIKNRKTICNKRMELEQVVINDSNSRFLKILVRDKFNIIMEYRLLIN